VKCLFLPEDAVDFPESKYTSYNECGILSEIIALNFLEIPIIWIQYSHKKSYLPVLSCGVAPGIFKIIITRQIIQTENS
jgi:hypothetical protein